MNASPARSRRRSVPLVGLLGLSIGAAAAAPTERSALHSSFANLPLTFEVNQGQTDPEVDFLARGEGYTLFLTPTEAVFALRPPQAAALQIDRTGRTALRMRLVGSDSDPRIEGLNELPGNVHYFRGNDPAQWRNDVRTYKRVRYLSVYPGVDLVYYGQSRQLEYDFVVAPGADPSVIKLAFTGIEDSSIDARGDLLLKTAGASLRFQKPVMYQVDRRGRSNVEGRYVRVGSHEVAFRVGGYDPERPLIIDPVLSYSTYLGGSEQDFAGGIAVDAAGATYVTGFTASPDFPTVNALQPMPNGDYEAFVAKLTPDGSALIYATYLGGSGQERSFGIAVNSAGDAHITGDTQSSDFPLVRAWQTTRDGISSDAFVAKLSADGSQLIYSTYLGGGDFDSSSDIAVDLAGAAYIVGSTFSPDFPAVNAFQPKCLEPPGTPGFVNAFVAKFTPDGTAAYVSYLGGNSSDGGGGIAVDSTGAAYITGSTSSSDFPLVNPVMSCVLGAVDAFVTKLAPDGKSLIYSTCLGGSDSDGGRGIALDVTGAAYVTGATESTDFPTMNAMQAMGGGRTVGDAFVTKLAPEGGTLIYSTYLGGSREEGATSISVDVAGAAYVAGFTYSGNFPTRDALQPSLSGGGQTQDAFVTKLAPDGGLAFSTYLGGSSIEQDSAIALDPGGPVYITGTTASRDFPTAQPLQGTHNGPAPEVGGADAFIAKITDDSPGASAGNAGISGSQSSGSNGGGSIDALLAVLLAQLTLARALRLRTRRLRLAG